MSDFLLELSQIPTAKKLIQSAGLPIPLPALLERPRGAAVERLLNDKPVVIGGKGDLADVLAHTLVLAGADAYVVGDTLLSAFTGPGEAYGRRPRKLEGDELPEGVKVKALVFDATGLKTTNDLKKLYEFYKPRVRALDKSGRLLVLGRPPEEAKGAEEAAVRAALEGFMRSVAKEVGKNGSTANLIYVASGAEDRLTHVLRFYLSSASAFVTGQPLRVTKQVKAETDNGVYTRVGFVPVGVHVHLTREAAASVRTP